MLLAAIREQEMLDGKPPSWAGDAIMPRDSAVSSPVESAAPPNLGFNLNTAVGGGQKIQGSPEPVQPKEALPPVTTPTPIQEATDLPPPIPIRADPPPPPPNPSIAGALPVPVAQNRLRPPCRP